MARKTRWWLDLRFLLTLETKKKNNLKTKKPSKKSCLCPNYVMRYRPDLHNLHIRKNSYERDPS